MLADRNITSSGALLGLLCRKVARMKLKPLAEQVIVITGASSGIGLVTARLAAERGASVLLIARNGQALARIVEEIRTKGGSCAYSGLPKSSGSSVSTCTRSAVSAKAWSNVRSARHSS